MIKIERKWAMPNRWTFTIKPIVELLEEEVDIVNEIWIDPFAGLHSPAQMRNDIDEEMNAQDNMDALEWLKTKFATGKVDGVLFDPPYSPRQISECYKKLGRTVNMQTTQSKFWADIKDEIARVVRKEGKVVSFGWNSNGMGKTRGFKIEGILLVAHGGNHNDTICVIERKI